MMTGEGSPARRGTAARAPDPNPASALLSRLHFCAAVVWLGVGLFAGLTVALQFAGPVSESLLTPSPVHSFGRLRGAHVAAMLYGVLPNLLLAASHGFLPLRSQRGRRAAVLAFGALQASLMAGVLALLYGRGVAEPWREIPSPWIEAIAVSLGGAFLSFGWAAWPMPGRVDRAPAMLIGLSAGGGWVALAAPSVFRLTLSPAPPPALAGLYRSQVIDAFFLPWSLGLLAAGLGGRRPNGWGWGVALAGAGMLLISPAAGGVGWSIVAADPPIEWALRFAPPAYALLVGGLLASFCRVLFGERDRGARPVADEAWRRARPWLWAGAAALGLSLIERLALWAPASNQALQFTDAWVGHHHLVLAGGVLAVGFGLTETFETGVNGARRPWVRWLADGHLTLTIFAVGLMVLSLAFAGRIQASLHESLAPWEELLLASKPYWRVRLAAGALMALALALLVGKVALLWSGAPQPVAVERPPDRGPSTSFHVGFLPSMLAGALLYACGWGGLALAPGGVGRPGVADASGSADGGHGVPAEFYHLAERDYPEAFRRAWGEPSWESFVAARERGRALYAAEGCHGCHTQYVRPGTRDVDRWGSPASPSAGPPIRTAVVGSRRVGPDLAHEAHRRSNDWHAAHLYAPRVVSPTSIMPAYPWLFDASGGRIAPNRDGLALIVYLQSLGVGRAP